MVCFTQNIFKFPNANTKNYINLLCKYYSGINVEMEIDNKTKIKGTICPKFFDDNLVNVDSDSTFTITTERYWSEQITIQCLPKYVEMKGIEYDKKNENIIKRINSGISSRLGHDCAEVYLSCEINAPSFAVLIDSFKMLNNKAITRYYISESKQFIVIVLDDRHTMKINCKQICDYSLPPFDVDDGFCGDDIVAKDLQEHFKLWLNNYNDSKGDTWSNNVINI